MKLLNKLVVAGVLLASVLVAQASGVLAQDLEKTGLAAAAALNGNGQAQGKRPVTSIIVFNEGVNVDTAAPDLAKAHGLNVTRVYRVALKGMAAVVPEGRLNALQRDPRVAYVEVDQMVQLHQQTIPTGVQRIDAEGVSGLVDVDIAIIDTGVDLDHPDLNVAGGFASYALVFGQWAFCGFYSSPWDDAHGHGTHVAGIAAAVDNDIGMVGVAPGARLWSVRVLTAGAVGCLSDIIAGVDWVTAHSDTIEVVNMSLGIGPSPALDAAISKSVAAGVTYVVSAGNYAQDVGNDSPAGHPDVITVSAIVDTDGKCGGLGPSTTYGDDDTFASFSNFGPAVDLAAPGVDIYSTTRGGGYGLSSGTSMSSPHVAGAAALYMAGNPGASPAEVRSYLVGNGVNQTQECLDNGFGGFSGDPDDYPEPLLYVGQAAPPSNTPPVANDQSVTTAEDTALALTLTGSDADGDPLTFSVITGPANGTLSGTPPDLTYTPGLNYNGPDSFTFKVNDGMVDSAPATVSITVTPVNDPPVADNQSVTVKENTPKAITLTGSDVDGDPLTFSVVTDPSNGNLSGTPPNLTYTPNTGFTGTDSFTFKANDGSTDSNVAMVSITVVPNNPPVANDQSMTTAEDTAVAITLTGSDADGDPLTFSVVTDPSHGILSGVAPDLTYTPHPNFNGSDTFTFKANDGTSDSNTAIVSITVNPINDAPVANDDAYSVDKGGTLTVAAPGVLDNDSDVEGDPLTTVLISGPAYGTLTLSSDGSFSYTHTGSGTTTDSFTYNANDGALDSNTAIVTITVNEPAAEVTVISIEPNSMTRGFTIDVTITGSGFVAGAEVTFENGDGPAPASSAVVVVDAYTITASVTAKSGGPPRNRVWDVRVTNPDGSSGVLPGGFTVEP